MFRTKYAKPKDNLANKAILNTPNPMNKVNSTINNAQNSMNKVNSTIDNTIDNTKNAMSNMLNFGKKPSVINNNDVDSRGFPNPVKSNIPDISSGIKNVMNPFGSNDNKPSQMPYKTDNYGFPKPKKCDPNDPNCVNVDELNPAFLGNKLVQDTLKGKERPKLKILDATTEAIEDIGNAAIHFAVTTGAVGLNKVLDIIAFTLIGLEGQSLNIQNKEEILKRLDEKVTLMQYLAYDEESKIVIRKLAGALGLIILEGSEIAKEPLLRAFINLSNTTTEGVNSLVTNAGKFIKNAIKIIPVIGDAYIILDNALAIAIAGSAAGKVGARNQEELAKTSEKILKRLKIKVEPPLEEYEQSLDQIDTIKDNLKNIDMNAFLQKAQNNIADVESSVGHGIKDAGNVTANAIRKAAPKPGSKKKRWFGGKKLKSSLKKNKNKKRKKSVRFTV